MRIERGDGAGVPISLQCALDLSPARRRKRSGPYYGRIRRVVAVV